MFSCQCTHVLYIYLLAIQLLRCHGSCPFFHSECFLRELDDQLIATLRFTLINKCNNKNNSVYVIKVTRKDRYPTTPQTICMIFHNVNGTCFPSAGCTCDPESHQYYVSVPVNATGSTQWELSGYLHSGQMIQSTTGVIDGTYCTRLTREKSTRTILLASSAETGFKGVTTEEVSTDISSTTRLVLEANTNEDAGTGLGSHERLLLLIIGVVSVVAVSVVLVLVGFVCHLRKRVDSVSSRLPPTPHRVIRTADSGVMFRVPPDEHRHRDSFVSVLGHDYAEIPYIVHSITTPTDNRLSPRDSFPVSDNSMSDDCLHHIACPSSDSSLSQDYLHPVASGSQAETSCTTRPHVSNTQTSAPNAARPGQPGKGSVNCDGEIIAELKAGPPYANM